MKVLDSPKWSDSKVSAYNINRREISWNDLHNKYVIYNVPSIYINNKADYYFSAEVTTKLMLIKELMEEQEVPNKVNYEDIADITT